MKLHPQIRMESQFGQIGIRSTGAKQTIEQSQAHVDIQQPPAKLQIKRTPSKLTIDQMQAWEEMNLKPTARLVEDFAQKGYADALEGTARRAEEGDELMRIEQGGEPIAHLAKRNSEKEHIPVNIDFIPSPFSVKTTFEPARLDVQWHVNKPIIHAEQREPIIEAEQGSVHIFVEREPSLAIDFVHVNFNETA